MCTPEPSCPHLPVYQLGDPKQALDSPSLRLGGTSRPSSSYLTEASMDHTGTTGTPEEVGAHCRQGTAFCLWAAMSIRRLSLRLEQKSASQ